MTFEETQRNVEAAKAELIRASADATGWADQQREAFNANRLRPLGDAAAKLSQALAQAQEAQQAVERLLAG